ncbi:MAG: VWA domain-containing protein [Deltaproteobacteria bacterium]|nr:VWA domain-containing protein [Deltaproteobacteria bacterium]
MRRVRYSRWNRSAADSPDAESVFEQLNDYMNETGDLQQAMRRLMQRGMKQGENKTAGLDDLMQQLARELRRLYDRYRPQSALDRVEQELRSVVEQERRTLKELRDTKRGIDEKREFLDRLPEKTSEAIEKLASYDFEDEKARADFEALLSKLEQIRELRRLESQLSSMNLEDVDGELLEKLLGDNARQDFEGVARMESLLEEGGYVIDRGDRFELSPRGVRRIGHLALRDIYQKLRRDAMGRHQVRSRGSHELLTEVPIRLRPKDFYVYDSEHSTRAATVLLLDMSWSMSWEGRFAAAKKVALAMETLVRSMHPRDYFGIVGFFTRAVELKPKDLPEATWNMGDPFTNLQDGLHLAAELLDRRPSQNQQMIVITDGQPTAYCRQGRLYCEWPLSFGGISQRAAEETLREAGRVTRRGITINTFMLDDSPVLKGFVDEMTRINRGRAFYTRPDRLGEYLLVDYVARKRKKV